MNKSIRKPYNDRKGYVASLKINSSEHAVIYDNKDGQLDLDTNGKRWVTVREPKGEMITSTALFRARLTMKALAKGEGF